MRDEGSQSRTQLRSPVCQNAQSGMLLTVPTRDSSRGAHVANLIGQQLFLISLSAFILTLLKLLSRFKERRVFSTKKTGFLFVIICFASAIASGIVAKISGSYLGVSAIAASYPFWSSHASSEPNMLQGNEPSNPINKFLSEATDTVVGFLTLLTDILDSQVSNIKHLAVVQISKNIEDANAKIPGHAPLWERVALGLEQSASYSTDEQRVNFRLALIKAARDYAESNHGDVSKLISLAYDWKVEDILREAFMKPKTSRREPI